MFSDLYCTKERLGNAGLLSKRFAQTFTMSDARERGCRARLQGGILADCPGNLECPKETSAGRKVERKN